jgi:hypothetical protein
MDRISRYSGQKCTSSSICGANGDELQIGEALYPATLYHRGTNRCQDVTKTAYGALDSDPSYYRWVVLLNFSAAPSTSRDAVVLKDYK